MPPCHPTAPDKLRSALEAAFATGEWLRVRGGSMRPLFRPGDEVMLAPLKADDRHPSPGLRRLGLAAYVRDPESGTHGEIVLHRVIFRRGAALVLKGDGAPTVSPPVPVAGLVGRPIARRRDGAVMRVDSAGWAAASSFSFACSLLRWARHAVLGRGKG